VERSDKSFWVLVLFGLPFIGVGGFLALAGFGVIPLPGDDPNAPLWVLGVVGLMFGGAGLAVSGAGIVAGIRSGRRAEIVRRNPNEPWLVDYPWNREKIRSAGFAGVVGKFAGFTFFCVFLVPFHWWGWISDEGNWFVRVFVGVFELFAFFFAITVVRSLIHWLKFGRTQLRFARFPFHPGEQLQVEFSPNRFDRLEVTLRYQELTTRTVGSGKNRSTHVHTETLHAMRQELICTPLDVEVPIEFDLPDNPEWVNAIAENPSVFWELEIKAEAPGVDFEATYKLPVYASV